MEKFLENLLEAEKNIKNADHMIYVTFPLIKDKRILLKILEEIKNGVLYCITSILQHDFVYKKINLYKNAKENFNVFVQKSAQNYDITKDEIRMIRELLDLMEKHKQSPFEFIKGNKIIILSNGLKPTILTLEKTKEFLMLGKNLLKKTKEGFKRDL
ncbi:MAG: hypothetical protein QXX55_01035 [Candidatus Pacearchaeota archaeon]